MKTGARATVRYPWTMVVPNGPALARSGSTWIHWWSSVASAKRLTCCWVMVRHRLVPSSGWSAARVNRSVGRATWVVMAHALRDREILSGSRSVLAEAFDDHGHAHAATDAHRLQSGLLVPSAQAVDQGGGDPGPGHAERVAQRDR